MRRCSYPPPKRNPSFSSFCCCVSTWVHLLVSSGQAVRIDRWDSFPTLSYVKGVWSAAKSVSTAFLSLFLWLRIGSRTDSQSAKQSKGGAHCFLFLWTRTPWYPKTRVLLWSGTPSVSCLKKNCKRNSKRKSSLSLRLFVFHCFLADLSLYLSLSLFHFSNSLFSHFFGVVRVLVLLVCAVLFSRLCLLLSLPSPFFLFFPFRRSTFSFSFKKHWRPSVFSCDFLKWLIQETNSLSLRLGFVFPSFIISLTFTLFFCSLY